jgi:hypothetical protein
MAAHRKLDQRRVYLCDGGLRKRASLIESSNADAFYQTVRHVATNPDNGRSAIKISTRRIA